MPPSLASKCHTISRFMLADTRYRPARSSQARIPVNDLAKSFFSKFTWLDKSFHATVLVTSSNPEPPLGLLRYQTTPVPIFTTTLGVSLLLATY